MNIANFGEVKWFDIYSSVNPSIHPFFCQSQVDVELTKLNMCVYSSVHPSIHPFFCQSQVDVELAKLNADKPEDDEELRKKLWLRIGKF